MVNDLNFTQNAKGYYEASVTSSGDPIAVKINRADFGTFIVYGTIDNLEPSILSNFGPGADQDLIFEIDAPADVNIILVSYTEVVAAKITGV